MSKTKKQKTNSIKKFDDLVSLELETNRTGDVKVWGYNSVYVFDEELVVEDRQSEDEREYVLKTQDKLKRCLYEVYIGLFLKRQDDTEEKFIQRVNDFSFWLNSKKVRKTLEYIDSVDLSYAQWLFHGSDCRFEDCYKFFGYFYSGHFNYLEDFENTADLSEEIVGEDFWNYKVYQDYLERIDIVENYCDTDFDYINVVLSTLFFYISAKRVGESVLEFSLRVNKLLNMKEIQDLRIWGKSLDGFVM